ncbi:MAG TPA: thioredoxin domain-containing protein, partial [Actinomycetaceae bacterium]|nr:thioredoxin domain-containing protein [Actinomycetaceae bacterium]
EKAMSRSQPTTPTKQERREAAREKARQLREAQARREKRNRMLLIGGVIVFVVLVGLAIYAIVAGSGTKPLEDVGEAPAGATESGAITVGAQGAGTVNEGAPELDIYVDYLCPYCAQFEMVNGQDVTELVEAGELTANIHPVSFLDRSSDYTGFSTRGAQATAVVAELAPDRLLDFHVALFEAQGPGGGVDLTNSQIAEAGRSIGLDSEVTDRFGGDNFKDWVLAATGQARSDGVTATPTILLDGEEFVDWATPGALAEAIAAANS